MKYAYILLFILGVHSAGYSQKIILQQAEQAFQLQDYRKTIHLAQQILQQDSLQMQAYVLLGSAYLSSQKPILAEETVKIGLRYYPDFYYLKWIQAEALLQRGLLDKAIPIYQQLRQSQKPLIPEISESKIKQRLGIIYQAKGGQFYRQKKYDQAETYLRRAKGLLPDSLSSYSNLGLLYLKTKQWNKTLKIVDEGLIHFPDEPNLIRMRANALYNLKDYDGVITDYKKLYDNDPEQLDSALPYAQLLLARGHKEEADKIYRKLLRDNAGERKIYESLITYYSQRNDLAAQRGVLQKMRQRFPNDGSIVQRIAQTFEQQGKWKGARQMYDTLRTIEGTSNKLNQLIAHTYVKQDNLEAAISIYHHALASDPDDPDLLRELGTL